MDDVDDKPAEKKMLLIGVTLQNCNDFLGVEEDGSRNPNRRSLKIPDTRWPAGETYECFRFALRAADGSLTVPHKKVPIQVDGEQQEGTRGYDAVVLTYEARHMLRSNGRTDNLIRLMIDECLDSVDNGWFYVESTKNPPSAPVPEHLRCAVCKKDRTSCGHFVGHGAL